MADYIERRGGARQGAGRKPAKSRQQLPTYSMKLKPEHAKLLRLWGGGNMSAGLRWLISAAEPLIRHTETQ